MIFNPPLTRKGVEVNSVILTPPVINFTLHVVGSPEDLPTLEMKAKVHRRLSEMVRYLELEWDIPKRVNWNLASTIILHNEPPENVFEPVLA